MDTEKTRGTDNDMGVTGEVKEKLKTKTNPQEPNIDSTPVPSQLVKTSGTGGLFPKDIPIGKVFDVRPVEYGLATVARVKLGANLHALDEIWVRFK